MNLFPEHIILNGKKISVAEFIRTSQESDFSKFLKEWYSSKSFIEVKTSGSTGKPKSIRLEKQFVSASVQRTLLFFKLKEG
ncbi:MAG: hypothetical protein LBV47_00995, partial [Bacteroidales bacterium]|nr:hypothetical protein [Bacteroidales bacterium]